MIRPAHRPLRSRHMVDDLGQTVIIGGMDLLAPLLQRIQRLHHRPACFIVQRNHDSLRTIWSLSLVSVPQGRAAIPGELPLPGRNGGNTRARGEAVPGLATSLVSDRHAVSIK